jgi:hypothetical protein
MVYSWRRDCVAPTVHQEISVFLIPRPAYPGDLMECRHCLQDAFSYDDSHRRRLVTMWGGLIRTGAGSASVIEDLSAPPGRRIVWFSFKGFAPDDYLACLHAPSRIPIGRRLLEDYGGSSGPLLSYEEIRYANSHDGLNMVCFHSGCPPPRQAAGFLSGAGPWMMEFQRYAYGGYRLKSYTVEVHDEETCAWAAGSGLRLRDEHRTAATPGEPAHASGLYGASAAEARMAPGTLTQGLFNYTPPRFGFTRIQQEVLSLALATGDTDEQVAARLGLAPVSVKKTWQGTYQRVILQQGDFFGGAAATGMSRGKEKKRWLLTYLRHHLEELRPHRVVPPGGVPGWEREPGVEPAMAGAPQTAFA